MNVRAPRVTVIIPVFDDVAGLRRCLVSLGAQTYPAAGFEVIVVDNGSREDVHSLVAGIEQVRLFVEPKPGSYAARNCGIAAARGDVLAFIDSDCVAAPDWIEKGVAHLDRSPGCGFVAGRVDLFFRDPHRPTASELYDHAVMNFHQERNVRDRKFGATANLFAFKQVFDTVGVFDPDLRSGGDLEWGRRVLERGLPQFYAGDTIVAHPARHDLHDTFDRTRRLVGGQYRLQGPNGPPAGVFLGTLARSLVPAVPFYLRLLRDVRLRNFGQRVRVVLVALGVKYVGAWELIRLRLGAEPQR